MLKLGHQQQLVSSSKKRYLVSLGSSESCGLPSSGYAVLSPGTLASTEKPISCPVQNIGHFSHGKSRALPSHVDRYGLRTMRGSTGGVRRDAEERRGSTAATTTQAETSFILGDS
jgi:hypothetical protein